MPKHWRAILFVTLCIGLVFVSVMAWHWEETAKKPFFYNSWPYIGIGAAVTFIGLVYWFNNQKNKNW